MKKAKKEKQTTIFNDFKKFISRGNIVDLAVGVIVGGAFTAIVNSLVKDIIMPLISTLIKVDITNLKVILVEATYKEVEGEMVVDKAAITLNYGQFIQYVINFLIIAISIFVTIRFVRYLRRKTVEQKVKYVLNLKAKHPELFDEEGEVGTVMYEKMKKQYPEYFQTEEAQNIESKEIVDVQQLQLNVLRDINENLAKLNKEKEEDRIETENPTV